jgi:hypothetical protein
VGYSVSLRCKWQYGFTISVQPKHNANEEIVIICNSAYCFGVAWPDTKFIKEGKDKESLCFDEPGLINHKNP